MDPRLPHCLGMLSDFPFSAFRRPMASSLSSTGSGASLRGWVHTRISTARTPSYFADPQQMFRYESESVYIHGLETCWTGWPTMLKSQTSLLIFYFVPETLSSALEILPSLLKVVESFIWTFNQNGGILHTTRYNIDRRSLFFHIMRISKS